jgi:hypothetical protein
MQNKAKVKMGNIDKMQFMILHAETYHPIRVGKMNLNSFVTSQYGKNGHLAK